jgi:hypothetical protein
MSHHDEDDLSPFEREDNTIGSRLYAAMAAVSYVAHNAETTAESGNDRTGDARVTADMLWSVQKQLQDIITDLGVKTPDDLRKIHATDRPTDPTDGNDDFPF